LLYTQARNQKAADQKSLPVVLSREQLQHTELLPPALRSYAVYTIPYECETQPIEKVWSVVKHWVSTQNTNKRTPKQMVEHLRWAFYGMPSDRRSELLPGSKAPTGITAQLCKKIIGHVDKHLNSWINTLPNIRHLFSNYTTNAGFNIHNISAPKMQEYWSDPKLRFTMGGDTDDEDDDTVPVTTPLANPSQLPIS